MLFSIFSLYYNIDCREHMQFYVFRDFFVDILCHLEKYQTNTSTNLNNGKFSHFIKIKYISLYLKCNKQSFFCCWKITTFHTSSIFKMTNPLCKTQFSYPSRIFAEDCLKITNDKCKHNIKYTFTESNRPQTQPSLFFSATALSSREYPERVLFYLLVTSCQIQPKETRLVRKN